MLRDWTDSEAVNNLSVNAERFFTRLIMKADDFGRFYGDPCLLRSWLYPRIIDKVKEKEISKFIDECQKQGLVTVYEIDGKLYLEIKEFGQRLRSMKSKFPSPKVKNDGHPADTCQTDDGAPQTVVSPEGRREEEDIEEKREAGREGERPPIPDEFLGIVIYDAEQALLESQVIFEAICIKTGTDPTTAKDALRKYHLYLSEKEQYPKGKKAVIAGFEKWLMNEKKFSNNGTKTSKSSSRGGYTNGVDPTAIEREGVGTL